MKLNEIYRAMLDLTQVTSVDEAGFVSIKSKDGYKPLTIGGKRLILPTAEQLKNSDWSNRIAFHALLENAAVGESVIQERYRSMLTYSVYMTARAMMETLLTLTVNTGEHSKLSPKQSEFLSVVKNADENTISTLDKIFDKIPKHGETKFIARTYLRRNGKIDDTSYARVCVVNFPFYEELVKSLTDPKYQINGVTLRKRDKESLIALYEYLLPNVGTKDAYTVGSNSRIAPGTTALVSSVIKLLDELYSVWSIFQTYTKDETPTIMASLEALKGVFGTIDEYIREIRSVPPLQGNTEAAIVDEEKVPKRQERFTSVIKPQQVAPVIEPTTSAKPAYIRPSMSVEEAATTPAPANNNGAVDFNTYMRQIAAKNQPQTNGWTPPYQQPPQHPWETRQQQPQYPQQQWGTVQQQPQHPWGNTQQQPQQQQWDNTQQSPQQPWGNFNQPPQQPWGGVQQQQPRPWADMLPQQPEVRGVSSDPWGSAQPQMHQNKPWNNRGF